MDMTDRDAAIRELLALTRRDPTGIGYGGDPAGLPAAVPPWWLWWGKATATWSSGNTVTLDPCTPAGVDIAGMTNVTGLITSPSGGDPADSGLAPVIAIGDVLAYLPYGNNLAVLINPKWRVNVAGVIPIGGIIVWSGAIVDIPTGWALCWDTSPTGNYEGNTTTPPVDGSTHGDGNHQHPAAGGTLNHDAHAAHTDTDNRGPWYAKAWIMRTA